MCGIWGYLSLLGRYFVRLRGLMNHVCTANNGVYICCYQLINAAYDLTAYYNLHVLIYHFEIYTNIRRLQLNQGITVADCDKLYASWTRIIAIHYFLHN